MIYNTYYAKKSFSSNKEALCKMLTANQEGIDIRVKTVALSDNAKTVVEFSCGSKYRLVQFMTAHIDIGINWENEVYD